ncbi:glycosyltransferase family 4 protein [Vibrio sp. VPAP30]|uniref:glycosyltransferase family 4 protein n=1 Tax=Vibrio sp. VPAP30 TaxID=1647102 RepID=UPI000658849C|nr:glycosyltransferase family 4 protein [Vibrio sp. VPAP30]KLN65595.1 hypothetical protein ZX61_08295 [Vibrio sp. VPAP30]
MKIVQLITRSDTVGGAQAHVQLLCQQLLQDKHQVQVFAGGEGIFHQQLSEQGISSLPILELKRNLSPISDFKAILAIRRLLKKERPAVFAIHSAKSGLIGRLAALNLGVKVVYTVHGWSHIKSASKLSAAVYKVLDRALSVVTDEIICVSQSDLDYAHDVVKISPEKTHLVFNGCNIPDLPKSTRHFSEQVFKLISVTRFQAPKDNLTLIKALHAANVQSESKKAHVDFYGEGEELGEAKKLVRELGLDHLVHFKGFNNNVTELYGTYDCFILSSLSEGLPMSIIEAMASHLPILATDVGGIKELVSEGENGLMFKPGGVSQLSEAIGYMMNLNKEELHKFKKQSFKKYHDKFTVQDMYLKTKNLYTMRNEC